jgi:hypothetical protein
MRRAMKKKAETWNWANSPSPLTYVSSKGATGWEEQNSDCKKGKKVP